MRVGTSWRRGSGAAIACRSPHPARSAASDARLKPHLQQPSMQDSAITPDGSYGVAAGDKELFERQGFLVLKQVLTEQELQHHIDPTYFKFLRREIPVPGLDLCDMSGAKGRTPEEFTVYNVMLPRIYHPAWQGNPLERRCIAIADQLRNGSMAIDFDQILAKRPNSGDSAFLWHQDAAYWPPLKSDTAALNCWLAVSDATLQNGCLRYIPGSHLEPSLRQHHPVGTSRADSHAIYTRIDEEQERVVDVPVSRGDLVVHHERVLHASRPNLSPEWRHAYVLGLRKRACIEEERALGFDHSHNSKVQWDTAHKWESTQQEGGGASERVE